MEETSMKFHKGQPTLEPDPEFMKEKRIDMTTMGIFLNGGDYNMPAAATAGGAQEAARENPKAGGTPEENIASLVEGLGGKDNINTIENCFTRLRVNVKDLNLVEDERINKVPNRGIVKKGNDIQVIIGLTVADVRKEVETYLETL